MRLSCVAAASSALVCLFGSASLLAQGAWSKVPAAPTSCFSDDDTFGKTAEAARSELSKEISAQTAYRSELQQKLIAIDPMTQSSRMVAYLQKDPSKAQEYAKLMGGVGDPSAQEQLNSRRQKLEEDWETHSTDFKSGADDLAPIAERFNTRFEGAQTTPAAKTVMDDYNGKYQKLCEAKIVRGPMSAWLKDFKTYAQDAAKVEADKESTIKLQAEVFGVPNAGFKSIAETRQVEEYMRMMIRVYQLRTPKLKPR